MIDNKVLYVGVSPKPYYGCNYWYVDLSGTATPKTFVWGRMGRHDTEQMVYVDSVRWCEKERAPYPFEKAKRVLRLATSKECELAKKEWDDAQQIFL